MSISVSWIGVAKCLPPRDLPARRSHDSAPVCAKTAGPLIRIGRCAPGACIHIHTPTTSDRHPITVMQPPNILDDASPYNAKVRSDWRLTDNGTWGALSARILNDRAILTAPRSHAACCLPAPRSLRRCEMPTDVP